MAAVTMPIRIGRVGLVIITLTLCSLTQAVAATIQTLEITHTQGNYHVTFDVLLDTDSEKAWMLLSDYHHWQRLSDNLEEAKLLERFPDGRQRIRLRFRSCVLIFCKTIRQIKDVTTDSEGGILTVMVPEQGDFVSGWEHWRILSERGETRVQYDAEIVPSFGLPPLIGPLILKGKLRSTLIETANRLETLTMP